MISFIVLFLLDNKSIESLVPCKHIAIHTGENPSQCSLCAVNICNHIGCYMCEKPSQCNLCVAIIYINNQIKIQSCVKSSQCSVCAIIICNHIRVHTCEKPFQSYINAESICCHSRTNTCEILMIKQVIKMPIRNILSIFIYHIMLIRYMPFSCTLCGLAKSCRNHKNGISLDHYQMSITHKSFTSHTKVYLLVCYGSGNTVSIYLMISAIVLSFIHCNRYQSNRMGLLRLVNLKPVRWSVIVSKYMITLYLRFLQLVLEITLSAVYWALVLTDMPFSCLFCGFEIFAIYHKNSTSWQHHNVGSIICNCMLSINSSNNYTTTLYICNG